MIKEPSSFHYYYAKQRHQSLISVLGIIILIIGMGTLIAGIVGISNIMIFIVKECSKKLGLEKHWGHLNSDHFYNFD